MIREVQTLQRRVASPQRLALAVAVGALTLLSPLVDAVASGPSMPPSLNSPTVTIGNPTTGSKDYQCPILSTHRSPCTSATGPSESMPESSPGGVSAHWTSISSESQPPELQGELLAYDPSWDAVVLVGGWFCPPLAVVNDLCENPTYSTSTWAYHEGRWTNLTGQVGTYPVGASAGATLEFDPVDSYLVLYYAAEVGSAPYPVTWTLRNTWTNLTLAADEEPGLDLALNGGSAATFDPLDGYLVLFGGGNQTWTFSGGHWSELAVSSNSTLPPSTGYPMMTWDTTDDCAVLFVGAPVGFDTSIPINQTWEFVHGVWTNITNATDSPPPDFAGYLFFDSASGRVFLLYGGERDVIEWNITWSFAGGIWTNLTANMGTQRPGWASEEDFASAGTSDVGDGYFLFLDVANSPDWGTPESWAFGSSPIPFLSLSTPTTESGVAVSVNSTVLGGDAPFEFNYSGLPPGCAAPHGVNFSCTPSVPASSPTIYFIGLNVTGSDGFSGRSSASLEVFRGLTANATISATALDIGMNFTIQVNAVPGTPPITYNYSGLPPPCGSANQPQITCAPNLSGTYQIHTQVVDYLGATRSFHWTVVVSGYPSLSILPDTSGATEIGRPLIIDWNVSGGSPPLRFRMSGLPPGCSLPAAPPLICLPSAPGTYTVTLGMLDAVNVSISRTLDVSVAPRLSLSYFGGYPTSPITLGDGVAFGANVSGGVPPYQYEYSKLPAGCSTANVSTFDCVPTATGSWIVTLTVKDALGVEANGSFVLTVLNSKGLTLTLLDWGLIGGTLVGVGAVVGAIAWRRRRRGMEGVTEPGAETTRDFER